MEIRPSEFQETKRDGCGFRTLIIGGDSQIGQRLGSVLNATGGSVFRTTRKTRPLGADECFFDLSSAELAVESLPDAEAVVICAGISTYASCSENPAFAARVNLANTMKLASRYLQEKRHVVFISSTAALGEAICTSEEAACSPSTIYGVLKRAAEISLEAEARRYGAPLTIVRLTKVVSCNTQFIKNWMVDARANRQIKAYGNKLISPISLDYACGALLRIVKESTTGVLHFSGERSYTYFEFARQLACSGLFPGELTTEHVERTSERNQTGCHDVVGLDMSRTETILSIYPQALKDVLVSLSADQAKILF